MSLIRCEECGKDISDQAKKCPNCGYPVKKKLSTKKPIWIKIVAVIFGLIAIAVLISALIDYSKANNIKPVDAVDNPLLDNFYVGSDERVYVIKFNESNILELVDIGHGLPGDKPKKVYGEYHIRENIVDISYSNGTVWKGFIDEDAELITIQDKKFNKTSPDDLKRKTLQAFDS